MSLESSMKIGARASFSTAFRTFGQRSALTRPFRSSSLEILAWEAGEMRTAGLAMIQSLAQRWQDQREIIALRVSPAVKAAPRVQTRVWDVFEHAKV